MSETLRGRIVKGIGSFYSVDCKGEVHICRPRGKFRVKNETPMVGDMVEFTPPNDTQEGYLLKILKRKNELLRPPVSNIDLIIIVIAATNPAPDLALVDKMLINSEMMKTESVICINKSDLLSDEEIFEISNQYKGHKTIVVSAKEGLNISDLEELCDKKTVCFAGQSGTGKTSILNNILPEKDFEVGEISRKTKRGRHTTRHAELVPFGGGYLVDTPGFSLLELPMMEPNELQMYYDDFYDYEECADIKTAGMKANPDAQWLRPVEEGKISKQRHERYCEILKEAENKWRRRYD